jgi:hypothetical protein
LSTIRLPFIVSKLSGGNIRPVKNEGVYWRFGAYVLGQRTVSSDPYEVSWSESGVWLCLGDDSSRLSYIWDVV